MTGGDATTERDVRAFVRSRQKAHDRRRRSDRLINAYMGLIVVAYVAFAVSGFIDADLSPHPEHFLDTVAWVPLVLLLVVWGVLRFATWQGPVLFAPAELQWLVSAPLSRRALVTNKLRRAFLIAAVAGALGGVVAAVLADVMVGEGLIAVFVVAAVGFAALALLATALSWHVERSSRWAVLLSRVTPIVLGAAALLALGAATGRDTAVWWSGPWGWATGPLVAEAGWSVPGWVIMAGLLAAAVVAAVASAVTTTERFSEEELWRRAEAHSAASAALFFGDVRTLRAVARRGRARGRVRGRTYRMFHPPSPWLAIASRDVLVLRRNPALVVTAAIFVAASFAAAVGAANQPILAIGAFIGLYVAAGRLLEPARLEADQPDAHYLLPWPWGTVVVLHFVVPTVVLSVLGFVGLAVVGAAGFVEPVALLPLLAVTPFAAAMLVSAAAVSAARRPFPVETLISGADAGSMVLILWLVAGPVLAAIAANIAFGNLREDLAAGISGATLNAIIVLAAATAGFGAWLWTRKPPE